jgi:hypothetical protein
MILAEWLGSQTASTTQLQKIHQDRGEPDAPEEKNKKEGVRGGTGVISFSGVRANFLRSFSSLLDMRNALEKDGT